MGCACKANQQISYLQKKYGNNIPQSKSTNIRGSIVIGFKKALTTIILIPFFPIMLIYLITRSFFKKNKPIDINKSFKIVI